jgi:hypothetical protein
MLLIVINRFNILHLGVVIAALVAAMVSFITSESVPCHTGVNQVCVLSQLSNVNYCFDYSLLHTSQAGEVHLLSDVVFASTTNVKLVPFVGLVGLGTKNEKPVHYKFDLTSLHFWHMSISYDIHAIALRVRLFATCHGCDLNAPIFALFLRIFILCFRAATVIAKYGLFSARLQHVHGLYLV